MKKIITTVEEHYQFYLEKMGLDESKMHPTQRTETRRVFFGSWGQLLMFMQNDIVELSDQEGFQILDGMVNEVGQFFINEVHNQN